MQEKLAESINLAVRWMHKQDLVNIAPPSTGVAFGSLTRHDRSAGVVVKGINHLALVSTQHNIPPPIKARCSRPNSLNVCVVR